MKFNPSYKCSSNLTPIQKIQIIEKYRPILKVLAEKNMKSGINQYSPSPNLANPKIDVRNEFAKIAGVDWAKRLERIEKIKANDRRSELNGKTLLTQDFVEAEKGEAAGYATDQVNQKRDQRYPKSMPNVWYTFFSVLQKF